MRTAFFLIGLVLLCPALKAQIFLDENFDNGINTSAGNWTIVDGGNSTDSWFGTVGGLAGQTLDGSEFALVDSDAAGSANVYLREELISPVLNTAGATPLLLEFDHYFRHVSLTDTGWVDVFDGTQWVPLDTFAATVGGFSNPVREQYDITAFANANLQIRFTYDDDTTWAWFWALDNVKVFTPPNDDAALSAFLSPLGGGRFGTSTALGPAEAVQVRVTNLGADTLFNTPVSYRIGAGPIVQETISLPIPPNQFALHTFATGANLAATGSYVLEAWTSVPLDADPGNDSLSILVRHLPNAPVSLPICQDFEGAANVTLLGNAFAPANLDELDFETNAPLAGRLRTAAGTGFYNSGNRAITLDRNASGALAANNAIFTYNFSNYDAFVDQIEMDLSIMDNGDEVHPGDSIWIRGCDACAWIGLIGWNSITGTNNGIYFSLEDINLSQPLFQAGQNYTASFQIRIGQEDNFDASSPTASDGLTFDDLCLTLRLDTSASVSAVLSPGQNDCGDSTAQLSIEVTNTGADTLFNIPLRADLSGAGSGSLTGILPGPLASGESAVFTFASPINTYAGGALQVTAYPELPGEQFPSDDTLTANIVLVPIPPAPQVTGDTLNCINTIATFAVQNPDPALNYGWYDSSGTTLLATGPMFSAGPLSGPATYQVEAGASNPYVIGRPDKLGPGANYLTYSDGLIFSVQSEIQIDSVDVYPNGPGNVVVLVQDGASSTVASVTVPVTPAGIGQRVTIPVGITLPPGNGYRMIATGTTTGGLFRNSAGSFFPYDVPGVATITGTVNGLHTSGYYYFFYNWQIREVGCPGPRTIVQVDTFSYFPTIANFSSAPNGLQVAFAATANGQSSWAWDFGDGSSSTLQNPSHTYALPGSYPVCLIAYGPCDNDTVCDTLNLTCAPVAPGYSFVDNGLSVSFTDTTPAAAAWFWDFGDGGTDTVPNPSHVFPFDNNYEVCLFVENVCGDTGTFCDTLLFCAVLSAGISSQANQFSVDFQDISAGNPVTWSWDFGDGNSSNQANPSHTYPALNQSYTVTLVVTNVCGESDTATATVQVVVGVENSLLSDLLVFPNPSPGRYWLSLGGAWTNEVRVSVYDLAGRRVLREAWTPGGAFREEIDLGGHAAGTYVLRVEADGKIGYRRIVKE